MKSAYELAMERLRASDPEDVPTPLSKEQKAALAEVDQKFRAKIAEREIFLQRQLKVAQEKGDQEALEQIRLQLVNERTRLKEDREAEKDRVRQGK